MQTLEYLEYQVDGSVGVLTINNLKKLNALSREILMEIVEFCRVFARDREHEAAKNRVPKISGLILTGAGDRAFIAGADIAAMATMRGREGRELGALGQLAAASLEGLPIPVIACVHGYALGGGNELAMACDFIYATEISVFGQPEVKLGLIPGFGGTVRLSRFVGLARAKELIYSAKLISAGQAKIYGLVNEVFDSKSAMLSAAKEMLVTIGAQSPYAVAIAKRVLNASVACMEGEGFEFENQGYFDVFEHPESREGIAAFLTKRSPNFAKDSS